ncbi:hypothetical protein Tco_0463139 [Tanacetum coccineum]
MSYSRVLLIVDVVMMCYTIRSAALGLVLPSTLVVSFPAGYIVFLLVAHCYYWSLVVTPGCMSVTAESADQRQFCNRTATTNVSLIAREEGLHSISDSFATTQQQSVTALVTDLRQKYGH